MLSRLKNRTDSEAALPHWPAASHVSVLCFSFLLLLKRPHGTKRIGPTVNNLSKQSMWSYELLVTTDGSLAICGC